MKRLTWLKNFAYLFVFMALVWLGLTRSFSWQELSVGLGVSFIVSLVIARSYGKLGLPPIGIKRLVYALVYLFVLAKEIIKANIDVAYRAIHPEVPINPGIVEIDTELESDIAKLILANSITLTPGTFTLDIVGDRLLIHWINVEAKSVEGATEIIGYRFEKYLKVIFG